MRARWAGPLMLALAAWCAAPRSASADSAPTLAGRDVLRLDAPEALSIRGEAHEVAGLYAAAGSLLGTAAAMALVGGLAFPSGDTFSAAGAVLLFSLPLPGLLGLVLLTLAAGEDAALSHWSRARAHRGREPTLSDDAEHGALSDTIAVVYGVGLGTVALSGLALVPIAVFDGFHTPIYLLPTVLGGLGLFTILGAAGMDITAGRWSGFSASIAPLEGGAMASVAGWF